MPTPWEALSKEEQCVLLGAAESALLLDLLAMWRPGSDYDAVSPVSDVPSLMEAVVSLLRAGFVEVYLDLVRQPLEAALDLITDGGNWWTPDGPAKSVELAETPAGRAVLVTADDIYAFRRHR